jgi:crotonobetainyl-CoA:carnitine CoA-transferase CaiB-like acyl-CoA transferase
MSNAAPPPDGLVVLDFTHTLAGLYCTMLMATSGANVIEIEEPEHGDRLRRRRCRCGEMIVRP